MTDAVEQPTDTNPDYRPPSVAEGTVAPGLVDALARLAGDYGAAGVRRTPAEMWPAADPPAEEVPAPAVEAVVEVASIERTGSHWRVTMLPEETPPVVALGHAHPPVRHVEVVVYTAAPPLPGQRFRLALRHPAPDPEGDPDV